MIRADQADSQRAMVLIIDVQAALVPMIHEHDRVVTACRKLIEGAACFELPVLVTEQYPRGLGHTVDGLQGLLQQHDARVLEKPSFSACGTEAVNDLLRKLDRPQVIVAGIEAHVCVQQTVLDLVEMDYVVYVCGDAVGSRGAMDYAYALDRMRQAGAAVTTVESVLFELCGRCDTEEFKKMLHVIKRYAPPSF